MAEKSLTTTEGETEKKVAKVTAKHWTDAVLAEIARMEKAASAASAALRQGTLVPPHVFAAAKRLMAAVKGTPALDVTVQQQHQGDLALVFQPADKTRRVLVRIRNGCGFYYIKQINRGAGQVDLLEGHVAVLVEAALGDLVTWAAQGEA